MHVTLIEPGGFDTDWAGPSAKHAARLPAYDEVRAAVEAKAQQALGQLPGDPEASAAALLKVVDAEEPPLRVFFGASPLAWPRPTTRAGYATGSSGSRSRSWRRATAKRHSPCAYRRSDVRARALASGDCTAS